MTYKKISKMVNGLIPKEFMIIDLQSLASVDFVGLTSIKKSLEKRTEKIIYVTNQKHHKGKGSLKLYESSYDRMAKNIENTKILCSLIFGSY